MAVAPYGGSYSASALTLPFSRAAASSASAVPDEIPETNVGIEGVFQPRGHRA
jgi:hypothetical protein